MAAKIKTEGHQRMPFLTELHKTKTVDDVRDFLVLVHKITLERIVRLTPALAEEIVEVAVKAVSVRECVETVNWLVSVIK